MNNFNADCPHCHAAILDIEEFRDAFPCPKCGGMVQPEHDCGNEIDGYECSNWLEKRQ